MSLSSTDIGKKFNKDHTTVLYTIEKIKSKLKENEYERKLVDDIIKNVKN
jgi:chromosomal replication initiation ATPase DnaA